MTYILGVESSCDETGIAVYHSEQGLLSNALYSQAAQHQAFGGVVPELASRRHVEKLSPLLDHALNEAGCQTQDLSAIGYTAGPGLIGALLCGATFAKALAYGLNIPCLAINHLKAHIMAALVEAPKPSYPFLALLVSGGHTLLAQIESFDRLSILGETLDDAVGEAYDKTAKLMNLGYPGGPIIAKLADKGDKTRFDLTPPMVNRAGLEMSFSGLKTQVRQRWIQSKQTEQDVCDLAAAFQATIQRALLVKCERALKATGIRQLVLAGGVSANLALRQALTQLMQRYQGSLHCPPMSLCTDNGGMIAYTAFLTYTHQGTNSSNPLAIEVDPRASLDEEI